MSFLKITLRPFQQVRSMGFIQNRSAYLLERIGNREMVTHGFNGMPSYCDRVDFPFPSIRYKETTPEIQALYEKQKGDWKMLTKEEKKAIYRSNFCQTFAEFQAPTGEWMMVIGYALMLCSMGIWLHVFLYLTVAPEKPDSFKPSAIRAQMRRQIDIQANPIQGIASEWDYEKNDWKRKRWNTPPNPFVKCSDDEM